MLLLAPALLAAVVGGILARPRAPRGAGAAGAKVKKCPPHAKRAPVRRRPASASSLLARGRRAGDDPAEEPFPPDSETIEGPDCGNVQQVIAQWGKAGKVGAAAGKAAAAVSAATAAAGQLSVAIEHAEGVGEVLAGDGGEAPESITMAVEKTGGTAKDALDSASAALETELEAFKALASGSEMAGADVEATDLVKLKELTEETVHAAKAAEGAAADIEAKAASAREKALASTETTLRLIKKALAEAEPALEEATDITQKLQWAIDDATAVVTKAEELVPKLEELAASGDEPDPVVEAFAGNVQLKVDAVKESTEELTPMVESLPGEAEALKEEVTKLQEAQQMAAGGATLPTVSDTLNSLEAALITVEESISTIKADVRNMVARQKKLAAAVEEGEAKVG